MVAAHLSISRLGQAGIAVLTVRAVHRLTATGTCGRKRGPRERCRLWRLGAHASPAALHLLWVNSVGSAEGFGSGFLGLPARPPCADSSRVLAPTLHYPPSCVPMPPADCWPSCPPAMGRPPHRRSYRFYGLPSRSAATCGAAGLGSSQPPGARAARAATREEWLAISCWRRYSTSSKSGAAST